MGHVVLLPERLKGEPYAAGVYSGCVAAGLLMGGYGVVLGSVGGAAHLPGWMVAIDLLVCAVCLALAYAIARGRIRSGRGLEWAAAAVLCLAYWSALAEIVGTPWRVAALSAHCCLVVVAAGVVIYSRWALGALTLGAVASWAVVVAVAPVSRTFPAEWWSTWAIAVAIAFAAQVITRTERGVGRRLRRDALTRSWRDSLTGLPNRRGFARQAEQLVSLARRRDEALWCAFVDVDHFKTVNDVLGHERGDDVLVAVASALRSVARGADLPARWGGDEFVLLGLGVPPDGPDLERRVADHLRRLPAEVTSMWRPSVSAGIGVATPDGPDALTRVLDTADHRMYERRRLTRAART